MLKFWPLGAEELNNKLIRYWSLQATGQDFGVESFKVSICSLSSIDQPHLSRLWLHAGKQLIQTAKEEEHTGQNAILEPISHRLMTLQPLLDFLKCCVGTDQCTEEKALACKSTESAIPEILAVVSRGNIVVRPQLMGSKIGVQLMTLGQIYTLLLALVQSPLTPDMWLFRC